MRLFKPYRETLTDAVGNAQRGLSIFVEKRDGGTAVLYADMLGTVGLSNTLTSDTSGEFSFWARDGIYRLTVRDGTKPLAIKDVVIGSGGTEETGTVLLADYLNASASNGLEAFGACFDAAGDKIASGKFGRVIIDCDGLRVGVGIELVVPGPQMVNVTLFNVGMLYATGVANDWLETDADDIAYFQKYETVSAEGKVWSLRKPILKIEEGNTGFQLVGFNFDARGDSSVRLASGIRVLGNTGDREIIGGKGSNHESYGCFVGADAQNQGQINIDGLELRPNSRTSRQDRTSYAFVLSGNDMHWRNIVGFNAHCPLLVGEYGSTTMFSSCDLFNGAQFDTEGFQHRLVEYKGNSCTWDGGRLGNGQFHLWNKDLRIGQTKFGITAGSGDTPPTSYFVVYATKAGDDLRNFLLTPSETPIDLATDIPWFGFPTPTGGNSWAIDTAKLATLKGYVRTSPSGKVYTAQVSDNSKVQTFVSAVAGAYVHIEDKDTDQDVGFGAIGNALQLVADVPQWEAKNNGTLAPASGITGKLGSSSSPIAVAYLRALDIQPSEPTLANNQYGFRKVSDTVAQLQMRGSDGVLRSVNFTLT